MNASFYENKPFNGVWCGKFYFSSYYSRTYSLSLPVKCTVSRCKLSTLLWVETIPWIAWRWYFIRGKSDAACKLLEHLNGKKSKHGTYECANVCVWVCADMCAVGLTRLWLPETPSINLNAAYFMGTNKFGFVILESENAAENVPLSNEILDFRKLLFMALSRFVLSREFA